MELKTEKTGKQCVKCGHDIVMRNAHRWPHDIIIECIYCHKKYKLEAASNNDNETKKGEP